MRPSELAHARAATPLPSAPGLRRAGSCGLGVARGRPWAGVRLAGAVTMANPAAQVAPRRRFTGGSFYLNRLQRRARSGRGPPEASFEELVGPPQHIQRALFTSFGTDYQYVTRLMEGSPAASFRGGVICVDNQPDHHRKACGYNADRPWDNHVAVLPDFHGGGGGGIADRMRGLRGTMHPKLWLFVHDGGVPGSRFLRVVVGSANMGCYDNDSVSNQFWAHDFAYDGAAAGGAYDEAAAAAFAAQEVAARGGVPGSAHLFPAAGRTPFASDLERFLRALLFPILRVGRSAVSPDPHAYTAPWWDVLWAHDLSPPAGVSLVLSVPGRFALNAEGHCADWCRQPSPSPSTLPTSRPRRWSRRRRIAPPSLIAPVSDPRPPQGARRRAREARAPQRRARGARARAGRRARRVLVVVNRGDHAGDPRGLRALGEGGRARKRAVRRAMADARPDGRHRAQRALLEGAEGGGPAGGGPAGGGPAAAAAGARGTPHEVSNVRPLNPRAAHRPPCAPRGGRLATFAQLTIDGTTNIMTGPDDKTCKELGSTIADFAHAFPSRNHVLHHVRRRAASNSARGHRVRTPPPTAHACEPGGGPRATSPPPSPRTDQDRRRDCR